MDDRVDPVERGGQGLRVVDRANLQIDARRHGGPGAEGVHRRAERVEDAYVVPALHQGPDRVRADESGTAGDQDATHAGAAQGSSRRAQTIAWTTDKWASSMSCMLSLGTTTQSAASSFRRPPAKPVP